MILGNCNDCGLSREIFLMRRMNPRSGLIRLLEMLYPLLQLGNYPLTEPGGDMILLSGISTGNPTLIKKRAKACARCSR